MCCIAPSWLGGERLLAVSAAAEMNMQPAEPQSENRSSVRGRDWVSATGIKSAENGQSLLGPVASVAGGKTVFRAPLRWHLIAWGVPLLVVLAVNFDPYRSPTEPAVYAENQLGATRQYLTVAILVYAALMLWVVSSTKLVLSDSGEYPACIKRPKIDECRDVIMLLSCRLGVQPRVPEGRLPMGRA